MLPPATSDAMKIKPEFPQGAAALATVIVLTTALFMMLGGLITWATNGYRHAARATLRARLFFAAESGIQYTAGKFKLLPRGGHFNRSAISNEFSLIAASNFPSDVRLERFTLADTSTNSLVLHGKYKGLYQIEGAYEVRCRVCSIADSNQAVELRLVMGSLFISPFQFGIFYNENLEIHPGADMTISGRVHSNKNIYMWPSRRLFFQDPVSCAGVFIYGDDGWNIFTNRYTPTRQQGQVRINTNAVGSPVYVRLGRRATDGVEFDTYVSGTTKTKWFDEYDPAWAETSLERLNGYVKSSTHGVETLTLPFEGAEQQTRVLIEPPISGESNDIAKVRLANRAAIVVETNDMVYYQTGPITNSDCTTRIAIAPLSSGSITFLSRTNRFWNGRQDYTINPTDFDMAKFKTWLNSANCPLAAKEEFYNSANDRGGIVYINPPEIGNRTFGSTNSAVRLVNAEELPRSLTLATPQAVYIKGNYNTKVGRDTQTNHPSAIVCDAVTPLSTAWQDSQNVDRNMSYKDNRGRIVNTSAANTTYNTALIAANSMSTTNVTGGGVHNLPRFLENWSGYTITLCGSLICMYESTKETVQHDDANPDYYSAPNRNYLFDPKLGKYATSPPGVPNLYKYGILEWGQLE